MRKALSLFAISVLLLIPTACFSETLDFNPYDKNKKTTSMNIFGVTSVQGVQTDVGVLSSAGLTFTESTPKVEIEVLKYAIALNDTKFIPLTIFSNLHASNSDNIDVTSDALLDPNGGLLNFSIVNSTRYLKDRIGRSDNQKSGLWLNYGGGVKIIEAISENVNSKYFSSEYLKVEPRLILDVLPEDQRKKRTDDWGLLQFGMSAVASYVNGDTFREAYTDDPDRFFSNINWFISIHLPKKFTVSGGSTLYSTEGDIEDRSFLTVSFAN